MRDTCALQGKGSAAPLPLTDFRWWYGLWSHSPRCRPNYRNNTKDVGYGLVLSKNSPVETVNSH